MTESGMEAANHKTLRWKKTLVGTAAWSLPKDLASEFAGSGSVLQRYALRFNCVEINSSFYRSHRPATYARWAASVPPAFRFAVKMPRTVTHISRLSEVDAVVAGFFSEISALGAALGCVLVQLPPSLQFIPQQADEFMRLLRIHYQGGVALEPRHPTWFTPAAQRLLEDNQVARVAADPAIVPMAAQPGGYAGFVYYRLHGSPQMYWSNYDDTYLKTLAGKIARHRDAPVWCIFDNTAAGSATRNALWLSRLACDKTYPRQD